MKINVYTVGDFEELCYLVIDENTNEAIMIDPGDEAKRLHWMVLIYGFV